MSTRAETWRAGRGRRSTPRWRLLLGRAIAYILLVSGSIVYVFPLLYMIRTALMPAGLLYSGLLVAWPPHWQNFVELWQSGPVAVWIRNSTFLTLLNVISETPSSLIVAFGFSRIRFRGRDTLFLLVMATLMVPATVTLVPQYILFNYFGWVNTYWPLIVPRFFGHPFYIFILRQFLLTLPAELDAAAEIDGANRLQVLTQVIAPISGPAIATVAVFSFMNHWNDFLEPTIYLLQPEKQTLAVGLRWFNSEFGGWYHLLMAGATLMTLPMIVAFFLAQKQFVRGIALTGIKT